MRSDTRRQFLKAAGAVPAIGLAGCTGDGNQGEETTEPDGTETTETAETTEPGTTTEVADARHLSMTNVAPSDVQFNPWGPNPTQITNEVIFDKFANLNYADGEYKPGILSNWEFTGDAFEMQIQEGATWHNGDPVTSEDFRVYFELDRAMGSSIWDWGGEIQTPDDSTVAITVEGEVNPSLVEFAVLENELRTKADVYGDIADQISEDDTSALTSFEDPDPTGNGIFQNNADRVDDQLRVTERFADHPNADNVNFSEYAFQFLDGNQAIHQALVAGEVESAFTVYTPPRVAADMPPAMHEYMTPRNGGIGLIPNHDHKDLGRRAGRQAIAHVLDRTTIAGNSDPRAKVAPRVPTALPNAQLDRWLGDSFDQFNTYGREASQTDEAASVLEDDGYSKVDGTWEDEGGEVFGFEMIAPAGWSDWVVAMETAADQLSSFGIQASFSTRPGGQLTGADGDWAQGNYDATAEYWTAAFARAAHPYFNALHQMVNPGATLRPHGYNYPGAVEARGGSGADITVPGMDGGELTVNPSEDVATLGTTTDTDEETSLALDLLWASNQDLPMIPIFEGMDQTFINGSRWDIPAEDAAVAQVKYANTWLPRQGEMQYSGD